MGTVTNFLLLSFFWSLPAGDVSRNSQSVEEYLLPDPPDLFVYILNAPPTIKLAVQSKHSALSQSSIYDRSSKLQTSYVYVSTTTQTNGRGILNDRHVSC